MKKLTVFTFLIIAITSSIGITSCKKQANNDTNNSDNSDWFGLDTSSNNPTGLRPATLAELLSIPILDTSQLPVFGRNFTLDPTCDLQVPPPKKQSYSNCAGWAAGYGMLGYQYKILEGYPDYNSQNNIFSPSYIWNQLNGGQNVDVSMKDALELLKQQGCCKWGFMPEDLTPYSQPPSASARTNAANYKINQYYRVPSIDIELIKYYLSVKKYPLPFSIRIDKGFRQAHDPKFWDLRQGGRYVWRKKSEEIIGNHGMLLCGYDDAIHAFKVLNSRGTGWGKNGGYCWIDYDFFKTVVLKTPDVNSDNPEIYYATLKEGVKIGSQVWMPKNLNVTTYRNGDPIPQVTDPTQWVNLTTGAWCYYNNDPANEAIYGKLYNGFAVNDPRGLAPAGWHVPSDAEWTILTNYLGGESVAGGKMKATTLWNSPNTGATNESGFNGLSGGSRNAGIGAFFNIGVNGLWYSSTEWVAPGNAWARLLYYNFSLVFRGASVWINGLSVRCIKD